MAGARGDRGRRTPRPGAAQALRALSARVEALEARLERLEVAGGREGAGPGDGRAAARPHARGPTCPGCGLGLRRVRGRCAECGRPVDL